MKLDRFRSTHLLLWAIVLWAAVLRIGWWNTSLPGLAIDEASNAWNAWTILQTGQDEWGQRWPIIATRAFDDYRSPLFLYLMMPFQWIGGLNGATARLPAALGGVATVVLIYWLGSRMFDEKVGLLAALLLAIAPWHIQHTRWGHEGSIGPLLAAVALAAVILAGAPVLDRPSRPRLWFSLLAGLAIGIACYGYAAVRIFIPVTLLLIAIVTAPQWWRWIRTRDGLRAMLALSLAALITFAPLAWRHLTDQDLNLRAVETRVWSSGDAPHVVVAKVLSQWPKHFNPAILFTSTPGFPTLASPDGFGWLGWYMLPMLVFGAAWLIYKARASVSARVLLVLVLAYPISEMPYSDTKYIQPMRCFPGILALCLSGAIGAVAAVRWLAARQVRLARWVVIAFCGWMLIAHGLFMRYFLGPFNDEPHRQAFRHVDLMHACQWLRPRFDSFDAVFITQDGMLIPHDNVLVWLNYDPRRWFAEPREYGTERYPYFNRSVCTKFGKVRIMYGFEEANKDLATLESNGRVDRVVMVLRPRQASMARGHAPSAIIGPLEAPLLLLYELQI